MASSLSFIEYVCEGLHNVTSKKMFGEYGIFYQGKMVLMVCDDILYIKPSEEIKNVLKTIKLAPPYKGSKDYYVIEEVDDKEYINHLILIKSKEINTGLSRIFYSK